MVKFVMFLLLFERIQIFVYDFLLFFLSMLVNLFILLIALSLNL